jgi:hypothetical protein
MVGFQRAVSVRQLMATCSSTEYHVGTDRNGLVHPFVSQPTQKRLKETTLSSQRPTACCVRIVTQPLLISDLLITAFPQWPDAMPSSARESNVFQQRHGPPLREDESLAPRHVPLLLVTISTALAVTILQLCRFWLSTIQYPGTWVDSNYLLRV